MGKQLSRWAKPHQGDKNAGKSVATMRLYRAGNGFFTTNLFKKLLDRHAELAEASLPLRCNGSDKAVEMLRQAQHDPTLCFSDFLNSFYYKPAAVAQLELLILFGLLLR
ncbi:hypothetical protein J0X19_09560 [Hymenobacter sp. BT186]|uniref:Uncharacterized protein n=1 Tax=Hymenobacter telluris TaxID=2816474 RepID=A0A939EVZ0_9BACT|nr:hypothetical protein [Hymenobacter telluris]MBO0358189.1 hypothetical protein [Hymenobacter telluris]MBW3374216.1 hypothetical protein [Hymenobacter norwichensis]